MVSKMFWMCLLLVCRFLIFCPKYFMCLWYWIHDFPHTKYFVVSFNLKIMEVCKLTIKRFLLTNSF